MVVINYSACGALRQVAYGKNLLGLWSHLQISLTERNMMAVSRQSLHYNGLHCALLAIGPIELLNYSYHSVEKKTREGSRRR